MPCDETVYLATVHWYGRSLSRECLTQVVGVFAHREDAERLVRNQPSYWYFADGWRDRDAGLSGWQPIRDNQHMEEIRSRTEVPRFCNSVWSVDAAALMPPVQTQYVCSSNSGPTWPPTLAPVIASPLTD